MIQLLFHGAYDNMSGCAGLLGIMEYMKDKERNYGLRDVKKQLDEYLFQKKRSIKGIFRFRS